MHHRLVVSCIDCSLYLQFEKRNRGVKDVKVDNVTEKVVVDIATLADFVGKPVFRCIYDHPSVRVLIDLDWTAMGASTLYILRPPKWNKEKGRAHFY